MVPVTVPIGCLMIAECFEQLSGWEAARKSNSVTLSEVGGARPDSVTSSDPAVFGVDAADAAGIADALLRKVGAELRSVPRATLLSRGPMPQGQHILTLITEEFQTRLDKYVKGDDFFACTLVFAAMRWANIEIADEVARGKILWDLYGRYIDACYTGTLESLGEARRRIVVLLRKDVHDAYYAYCLGFNFATNYVVTAHHCLVDPEDITLTISRYKPTDPDAVIKKDGPLPQSRALVLGEPGRLYELQAPKKLKQNLNFYPFELDRDTVILELVAPNRPAVGSFPVGEPTPWAVTALPAFFADDDAFSKALASGSADAVARVVADGSAIDISPLCTVVFSIKSTKPFIFHSCQSRYGYSGGPILQRKSNGEIVLVGIHDGIVNCANPVDNWPYARLFPNYGLRIPELVRTSK
jgi:hypothetical protein